jgi:tape measure domain-containing protein
MDVEGLKLKIDSKGARADLAALSAMFDKTAASADRFDQRLAKAATSTDQNLTRAARSMAKYAEVATLMSKIKIASAPLGQVQQLGKAIDAIGRAKQINPVQVSAVKELALALGNIRVGDQAHAAATFLNTLGRARTPSQAQIRNVRDFITAIGSFKGTAGTEQLSRLLNVIATARAPSKSAITRFEQMFGALGKAKEIPGAGRIANQLDTIALAANRASKALGAVPLGRSGSVPAIATGTRRRAASPVDAIARGESEARKATTSFAQIGRGLDDLGGHFRLASQAGMLLSSVFATFTAGAFLRGLYDANIQLLKLQKAVLFATDSFDGAERATDRYISMSQDLGISIKDNIETYGRFVIASKAAGVSLTETNKIYHAVGQALTVVGASAQQQQLAFYGLTEMLQKGVVYSKEFNRQIGAQLPGNAILGARALSELEHRTVSVSEFFEKMHTGTLLSPEFVPAWAKAVEDMYHPLLALAQARPDVALTRLNNAFFVFARAVGQGSFMTAIGRGLTDILNKIVTTKDGVTSLTPTAQHLADTLGQGLATAIHALGAGVGFLVDHFDSLFTAIKGFVAFKLAGEFGAITGGAIKAAAGMLKFADATRAAAASEAVVAGTARTESAVAAIAAPTASSPANIAAGLSFGRRAPSSAFQRAGAMVRPAFGQRLNLPLFNWANAEEARVAARPMIPAGFQSVTGAALREQLGNRPSTGFWGSAVTGALKSGSGVRNGIGAVFERAASAMSLLGPAATAAAVGLAMFSDKASGLVTGKGNSVTYGDISSGVLSNIGDSVQGFVKSVGESFGMFGANALTLGKVVLSVAAVFKAAFSLMFDLAHALGTVIGGAIASLVAQVMNWGKVISDVVHGNITGAVRDWRAGTDQQQRIASNTFGQAGSDIAKIFTTDRADSIYKQMSAAADRSADGRISGQHADEATRRNLEASLRQQSAAATIEQAAQKFSNAAIGLDQIQHPISLDSLMSNIRAFATGKNLNAGLTPAQIAAAGPGANSDVRNIVGAAAAREGIDPALLLNLGISETHFDPRQYGWNRGGTSARGPFQLTSGALADLSRAGYDTSDAFSLKGSAPLAAAYLRMSQDSFRRIAGRDLRPEEALLPYKFGGAGAARLANSALNPDTAWTLAKDLFPDAAKAPANHSLFFSGKGTTTPLTSQQTYAKIIAMATGSTPNLNGETPDISALAPDGAGGPAADAKIETASNRSFKQFMAVIGEGSPGAAAFAQMQEKAATLTQAFQKLQAQAAQNPFQKTFLSDPSILKGLSHALDELKRRATEAMDPVGTLTKYQAQASDVTALRVKGLTDEARWQDQVNRLVKEGYTLDEINQPGRKQAYLAEIARTDVLQSQLELQKALNEIETRRMDRLSNSGASNILNGMIANAAQPGETLAQARTRLTRSGQMDVLRSNANAQYGENVSAAAQGLGEDITSMRQQIGLNPDQRQFQSAYIEGLQKLTGINTNSIQRLQQAAASASALTGKNLDDMAKHFAALKTELENPPGFQRWVDGLEPMARRLDDLKVQFADGLSDNLTKALTGDKTDWRGMFKSLQQGWVKGQVDNFLSGTFKTLGLAQPQTPEQVQMVAAQTFASGADLFSSAVTAFAAAVGGSAGGVPALRGSVYGSDDLAGASLPSTAAIAAPPAASTPSGLVAANDNASGFLGGLGKLVGWNDKRSLGDNIAGLGLGALGLFGNLLFPGKKPDPTYHMPAGIIGAMSQNTVSGTYHPAQANILGSILNFGAQSALNAPGGTPLSRLLSLFEEGGYATSPVRQMLGGINMSAVPHYAEGTHNTSGIPAVLHPNEAVIPLSRGRKIPVEMNDNAAQPINVASNITVIAPNPDAFRKASGSIKRDQNRSLKRAATRNLTGT